MAILTESYDEFMHWHSPNRAEEASAPPPEPIDPNLKYQPAIDKVEMDDERLEMIWEMEKIFRISSKIQDGFFEFCHRFLKRKFIYF